MTIDREALKRCASELLVALSTNDNNCARVSLEPGDMTRYDIVLFVPAVYDVFAETPNLVLSLVNFGKCMEVPQGEVHWTYVADKLDFGQPSAEFIAGLLNELRPASQR